MTFETRFSLTEMSLHEMQTIRTALNRMRENTLTAKWDLPYLEHGKENSPVIKALEDHANDIGAIARKVDAAIERDLFTVISPFEFKTGV